MGPWLVAEDDPDLYYTILAIFELWKIECIGFTSVEEAIQWIDRVDAGSREIIPDLALLDVLIEPHDDGGVQIARHLR